MQRVVKLLPKVATTHFNLGTTYQGVGMMDEAEASYLKAHKLEPSNINILLSLCSLHVKQVGPSNHDNDYPFFLTDKPPHASFDCHRPVLLVLR